MKKPIRLILISILGVLVVLSLTGCSLGGSNSSNTNPVKDEAANNPTDKGQQGNNLDPSGLKQWDGVKGKLLTENYPEQITKYLDENKAKETQQAFNINNKTYIVMTMGEQNSAGYLIELKDLVLKDGVLKVFVKYEKPGKDDIVATVITYPSLVIETDDIYEGHYEIQYEIEK